MTVGCTLSKVAPSLTVNLMTLAPSANEEARRPVTVAVPSTTSDAGNSTALKPV